MMMMSKKATSIMHKHLSPGTFDAIIVRFDLYRPLSPHIYMQMKLRAPLFRAEEYHSVTLYKRSHVSLATHLPLALLYAVSIYHCIDTIGVPFKVRLGLA